MRAMTQLFRLQIGAGDMDAFLLRLAQAVCFLAAGIVRVVGLLEVSRQDLAEAQFFSAVQQVVQTALLFCIVGLLLNRKSNTA